MVKQIKILLPTISIPEFDGKSKEEQDAMLAIYIMQFGILNYQITLKALNNIIHDEKKMEKFTKTPIPTLARESVNLTAFTNKEKEKYNQSKDVEYENNLMTETFEATNKVTHQRELSRDIPWDDVYKDYKLNRKYSWPEAKYLLSLKYGKQYFPSKRPAIMDNHPKALEWERELLKKDFVDA